MSYRQMLPGLPRMNPRYLVLHRKMPVPVPIPTGGVSEMFVEDGQDDLNDLNNGYYYLHGAPGRPTLFTTLKMAHKAARDGYTYIKREEITRPPPMGKILLFDVDYLPELAADQPLFDEPGLADRLTELELCERQMLLWHARAERLASGK